MPRRSGIVSKAVHRKLAGELFNHTWTLLDRKRRTREEDDAMLSAAQASRYHWSQVGGPLQASIGEWQISRVNAVLGRLEAAEHHGRRALHYARAGHLEPFYVAYAYEALGRAAHLAGDRRARDEWVRRATRLAGKVADPDDRRMLLEDLAELA